MKTLKNSLCLTFTVLLGLALPALQPSARADVLLGWSGNTTGPGSGGGSAWLTPGNWTNNLPLPSTNDTAFFGAAGTVSTIGINFNGINATNTYVGAIVLGGGSTIDRVIGNSSTTAGGTLSIGTINGGAVSNLVSGRTLTLAPYSASGNTFPMTLTFLSNATFNAVAGASNIVTAVISGTANITNTGAGQLALLTNNTFTGKVVLLGGSLLITNEICLGANPAAYVSDQLTLDGGTLRLTNNSLILISNANRGITINAGGGTFVTETNTILGVVIAGTGALTKNGTTNSVLSITTNNNTFTGNITVNFGGINVKNSSSLGVGPKTVTINNGSAGMTHMILDTNGTLGAAADINLPSNISFNTSFNVGTVTNTAGNNIIQGNITMTSGGGDTLVAANGGTLTLRGAIAPNTTARALRLGGTGTGTNTVAGPVSGSGANAVLLAKQDSGTWTLTGTNSHTGNTLIIGGTLIVSGSGSFSNSPLVTVSNATTLNVAGVTGGFTLETNQTLNGSGIVVGAVTFKRGSTNASSGLFVNPVTANAGSRMQPGGLFVPATMIVSNALTLNSGCTLDFDLAANPVANSGSNDLIVVNGSVSLTGPVPVTFSFPLGGPTLGVPYTLFRYSGSLSGGANLAPAGLSSGVTATFDTSVPGYVTVSFTAAAPNTIVWTGTNGFNWDFATSVNFSNTAGAAVAFNQLDNVLFDDSSTNQAVTLVGINLQPTTTTVNSSSNFTFSGAGALAGGSITKSGTGTLNLNTVNTYAGQTFINAGTVKLGAVSALGATNGPGLDASTIIASGATLDVNANVTDPINESISVQGAGVGGLGAMINSGAAGVNKGLRATLTLAGDTTFSAANRWDMIGGRVVGGGFKATKLGTAEMFMNALGDTALGDIDVQAGLFTWGGNSTPGDPTKTYTIRAGAILNFFGPTVPFNKMIAAQDGSFIQNGSGTANLVGTMALIGAVTVNNANPVNISNVIGGVGALLKSNTAVLTITGTNTYSGGTFVWGGQLQGTTDGLQGIITNNSAIIVNQDFNGTLAATVTSAATTTGHFTKRGLGRVVINTPMTIGGNVTNEAGTVALGADNVMGFGTNDWRGISPIFPAIESADATTRTLTNSISISSDTRLGSAGSGNLIFSGPINNGGGNKVLTISNAVTTFSSGFFNTGNILKQGPGQFVLGSSNNNGSLIISNGLVTLSAGAFFMNNPHLTNLPGGVLDVSAAAEGKFNLGAARNLVAGRPSGFANDIIGGLSATGTVIVAASNVAGTLTVSGDLSATGGAAFSYDLANVTTTGAGVNDFINVGGTISLAGTIAVNVNLLNGSLPNGTYTLMTGTAAVVGAPTFALTGTNAITRQNATVAISGNSVVLNVTGSPIVGGLTWLGTNVNWDLTTTNWWSGSITDRFFNADSVVFDNSSTNTNVVITTTILPGTVTVNSSSNYVFSGAGLIGGGAVLNKSGSGTLSLGNANTYIGTVNISGGTIKQANAGALGNSLGVNITAGGGFDFAGLAPNSRTLGFTIAGTGADGFGAIKNTGGNVSATAISNVTLSADSTIGAHGTDTPTFGRMDIGQGYGLLNGSGNKLTKIGPGYLDIRSFTVNLPELIVAGGTVYSENIDNNLGTKVTVNTGARLGGTGLRTYTNRVDLADGSVFFTAVGATASTWTGPVNVPAGNVFIGNATISGGGGAQDLRITTPLNGAANLLVTVHPLELSANNDATFSGNITVNATTLRMTNSGTHGSGVITNNSGTVDFSLAANYAFTKNIYGPNGTVTKSATNTLQLAGAGGDQIADGQLLNVLAGAFDLNGRSEAVRGLTGNAGALVANSAGGTVSLVLTNPNATHTYNGSIGGPVRVVVLNSTNRNGALQSFTGTNTFTGGLVIDNGQLRASGDFVLGAVPGVFDPANIILRNNGTIQNNSAALFIHPNRGVFLESDGTFMAGFSAGNDIVVSGVISGPGRLLKADGQRLILKNANTFTGDTVFTNISATGAIRIDHPLALQNSTFDATGLGANGNLDLNNMDVVIGMLKGTGATISNFNGRLTVGGNGQNGVFASTLSGAGNLVKIGPGVLVLAAANSPYNGGTIVSNGALINLGNLSGAGAVVVKSGAILGGSGSFAGPVTAEPGASVYPGASAGTMTISNSLSLSSDTLFFELANTTTVGGGLNDLIDVKANLSLAGVTTVRFSFLNGSPALGIPYTILKYAGTLTGGAANLAASSRFGAVFDTATAGEIRVTFSGSGSNLVWTGSATNNTWNLDTFTNFFNGVALSTFKDGDSVTFNDSGYAGAPVNVEGLVAPPSLTVNAAQDYTFSGLGRLSSPSGLTKLGAGKVTLTGSNDITGPLTVNAGTISIGVDDNISLPPAVTTVQLMLAGGTLQATGSFTLNSSRRMAVGPTNAAGSGAIDVTGTNTLTYGGIIGNNLFGLGTLVKTGPGTLALSGANTYSGGTTIRSGTVLLRSDTALGSIGAVTMGDAGTGTDPVTLLLDVVASGVNRALTRDLIVGPAGSGTVTIGSTAPALAVGALQGIFGGAIVLNNHDVVLRSGAGDLTRFTNAITGTGNIFIANGSLTGDARGNGGNRVFWDNISKTFVGDVTILSGPGASNMTVLQIGSGAASSGQEFIPDGANVTVQNNAILRLFANETINGLTGAGRVRGVVNQYTLSVGASNASSSFTGLMENDAYDGGSLALTKVGTGTLTLASTNTYTGPTLVSGGTLALSGIAGISNSPALTVNSGATLGVSGVTGGFVLMGNQTLNSFGTVAGNVTLASNATVNPGLSNVVGTLAVSGNLTLNNSNRFNFELGSTTTIGGGVNDLIDVTGDLSLNGISYVTVGAAGPLAAGTYTLMRCTGTKTGGAANLILINTTASAMTLGETANSITLTVTTAGRSLVWAANFTNSLWDINTTTNWLNGGVLGGFLAGDAVLFDSSASNATPTLNVTALPSTVSLTGATNYTVSGSGKITGPASILQNSSSTNTMSLANDFSGAVTINGGVLKAGSATALGNIVGSTIVNSGGTLDVNAINLGAENFIVSGTGYQGQGAIINNGAGQNNATRFVTLAGDTTFGGVGRWDIRSAGTPATASLLTGGNPFKLTKVGGNQVSLVDVGIVDPALGDIDVLGGIFSVETGTRGVGNPAATLRVGTNAALQFFGLVAPFNKQVVLSNASRIISLNASNTMMGPISLIGSNQFDVQTPLAISNSLSGAGTLWKISASTLLLAGNNTYSGGAVVQAGLVTLTGNEPNSGGYSNGATLNIGNLGNSGTISGLITNGGTLNLLRADSSVFNAAVIGAGTINHASGSGPVTFSGGISNATLRLLSGNTSPLTLDAGSYAFNSISVGPSPSGWMTILPGANLFANSFFLGDANTLTGFVAQVGGTVIVTNQFRLGHFPNNVSTYLMGGGTLTMPTISATTPYSAAVAEVNGGFYIGIDGVGTFTQTGGVVNVPGVVLDNRGASTLVASTNTYDLRGGTLTLGQWGFLTGNSTYQINLGGGTVASSLNWTSTLNMRLTGTGGDVTFNPAGFNNFLFGILAGPGGLNKAGAGSSILSNASTFTGNTLISGGTLALVGSGGLASSANIIVGPGAVLDTTLKTGGFTVGAAQTLSGGGSVLGVTAVAGRVAPGASIGTLTFDSALTLSGTTTMEIDRGAGPNADLLVAPSIALGGALIVTNIGVALQNGDSFDLFNATLSGGYTSILLPSLPAGLGWDTSALFTSGVITVITAPSITTPPASQTIPCHGNASFSVVAAGTPTLFYQWRSNGVPIVGATGTSLMLNDLFPAVLLNISVVVTNNGGSITSAPAIVTIADTVAPSVTCPANLTLECTSSNGAVATFTASATDTCDPAPTVVCVPASGSTFPIGTNTVTCTASDASGNTNACTFKVTIIDTTPPSISTCATNRTLSVNASCLLAVPNLTGEIVATDICGVVVVTQSPVAGTLVPRGSTVVTFTATDPASNSVTCTATLTVIDGTGPVIACPANLTVQCDADVPLPTFAGGSVSDNCDPSPVVTHVGDASSGSCPRTIVRTYRATDASGNTNDCAQTITVRDTIAPSISCPANVAVQCLSDVPPVNTGSISTSDNCDPSPAVTHVSDVASGVNPVVIRRTYRSTDACGNTNDCAQIITVQDTIAPIISTCAPTNVVLLDTNLMGAPIPNLTVQVMASDNCGSITITQNPPAGTIRPEGTNVVLIAVVDGAGNVTTCNTAVIITEAAQPPTIVGQPQSQTVQCSSNATFSVSIIGSPPFAYQWYFGVSAIANATNSSLTVVASPATAGSYSVTVTNTAGSSNSLPATLTVIDTIAPVVVCPAPMTVRASSTNGAVVGFSASASDACDMVVTVDCVPASGSLFPVGATTVTCSAVDSSSNTGRCSFVISVCYAQGATNIVNGAVPDAPAVGLASTIPIASPLGVLSDVNVSLNLSNGWNGDLYVYLVHDSGFSVLLNRSGKRAADPLGYNDSGYNVTLDDQAAADIHNYRFTLNGSHSIPLGGPLTNSWQPDGRATDPALVLDTDARTELLSSFNGLNPNGEWNLFVADVESGDVATLVSWGLDLCGTLGVSPAITQQPQSLSVNCGSNVTFSVTATGTGPIGYHWRRNGTPIPGANSATLSLPSVLPAQAGSYSVIVSNAFGNVTSDAATLTVSDVPPVISGQPQSRTNNVGTTATFSVTAVSCSPIAYQWFFGLNTLTDATNATLSIPNVQLSNAGGYTVKLSNFAGSVTSAVAVLTVNRLPIALPNGGATLRDKPLAIVVTKLLNNDSDPDGDPLTLDSVSATSTNGGGVVLAAGKVTYTPKPGFIGIDRYSYTISDGRGGFASADVEILVADGNLPSQNQVSLTIVPGGVLIRFAGIPGFTYSIQRAPAVTGPWTTLNTSVAPLHGIVQFLDTSPLGGSAFYRTVSP